MQHRTVEELFRHLAEIQAAGPSEVRATVVMKPAGRLTCITLHEGDNFDWGLRLRAYLKPGDEEGFVDHVTEKYGVIRLALQQSVAGHRTYDSIVLRRGDQ